MTDNQVMTIIIANAGFLTAAFFGIASSFYWLVSRLSKDMDKLGKDIDKVDQKIDSEIKEIRDENRAVHRRLDDLYKAIYDMINNKERRK